MNAPYKSGDEFTIKDTESYYNGLRFKVISCSMMPVFGSEADQDWHVAAVRWIKTKQHWSSGKVLLRVDGGFVR